MVPIFGIHFEITLIYSIYIIIEYIAVKTKQIMTFSGKNCIFPFVHEGKMTTDCILKGKKSVCPVKVDHFNKPLRTEECDFDKGQF